MSTTHPAGTADGPLVSVVLPTHDRAHLLRRAIDSVLAQTYPNLELIVVDDASADDTPAVVRGVRDPRVRYLRQPENRRAAAARNAGIAAARGDLVAFQDDDDEWLPGKLARQVPALLAEPDDVGLCLTGYFRWERGGTRYIGGAASFAALDYRRGLFGDYDLIATPGWLARKAALVRAGLFDERFTAWDDWELGLRLARQGRFTFVDEPLFVQDRVNGSAMWFHERNFGRDLRFAMLDHGAMWAGDRDVVARHCAVIGRIECESGNVAEGRAWLRRAARARPFGVRPWGLLALSRLGPGALAGAGALKRRLAAAVPRSGR